MSSFGHHNLPLCVGGRGGFFAKANARRAKSCQSTSFPFSSRECRYASTWHKIQPRLKNREYLCAPRQVNPGQCVSEGPIYGSGRVGSDGWICRRDRADLGGCGPFFTPHRVRRVRGGGQIAPLASRKRGARRGVGLTGDRSMKCV